MTTFLRNNHYSVCRNFSLCSPFFIFPVISHSRPFTDKIPPTTEFLFRNSLSRPIFALKLKQRKMAQTKKMYRTVNDKVIAGVAGGLAEYFEVDVVIFRLLFVLLVFFGGGGVLAYIIMWIVIPPKRIPFQYDNHSSATQAKATGENANSNAENASAEPQQATPDAAAKKNTSSNTSLIAGIILIAMGVLFLINRMMPWVNIGNFWPVLLIIGGFLVIDPNILKSKNRQQ